MKRDVAVALQYEHDFPAPFVVASAKGDLAQKLRKIALDHDIPIRREADLADALFGVEVGAFIPEPFYRAVAELLVSVMSERGDRGVGEDHKSQ